MAYKFDQVPNHYAGPIIQHIEIFVWNTDGLSSNFIAGGPDATTYSPSFCFCSVWNVIHGILYTELV